MAEIVLVTEIPREKGYLYYIKTDEKGNIVVWKSEMARRKKKEENK